MEQKNDKILVVGDGYYPLYERAIYQGFLDLGYQNTRLFTWNKYFDINPFGKLSVFLHKAQNKFQVGPFVNKINKDLLEYCIEFQPDLIFIQSGILVYENTVREMKERTKAFLIYYNNDDPFSDYFLKSHWRHYKAAIKYADYNFTFRKRNWEDVTKINKNPVDVLLPYYIEQNNYPVSIDELIEDTPEVLFLGHYEEDERNEYIQALTDLGIRVGVPEAFYSDYANQNDKVEPIRESRKLYNNYLCSCKIPLIFYSKINHDTYTTRCFEIPAAGGLIFSPFNVDMASMFEENKEAVYFRNKEEFVNKAIYYLEHDKERQMIAKAGRERLLKDGHEVKDRVKQIILAYEKK